MAEIRNPAAASPIPTARVAPAARIEAAREAQRAFFNAALAGDVPAVETAAPVRSGQPLIRATPAAPDPRLRPGSIIDIKV